MSFYLNDDWYSENSAIHRKKEKNIFLGEKKITWMFHNAACTDWLNSNEALPCQRSREYLSVDNSIPNNVFYCNALEKKNSFNQSLHDSLPCGQLICFNMFTSILNVQSWTLRAAWAEPRGFKSTSLHLARRAICSQDTTLIHSWSGMWNTGPTFIKDDGNFRPFLIAP